MNPTEVSSQHIQQLLQSSIELELNVSELYLQYSVIFEEDKGFWWQLALEEKNHAALLRSAEHYVSLGIFPREVLLDKLDVLHQTNRDILNTIRKFKEAIPEWEPAYRYALLLENSAAELHFQDIMTEDSPSKVLKIFQALSGDDKDHALRIRKLIQSRLD